MALEHLFTTARVLTAVYRIVSTTLLLAYLAKRLGAGKPVPRRHKRAIYTNEFYDSGYQEEEPFTGAVDRQAPSRGPHARVVPAVGVRRPGPDPRARAVR